MAAETMKITAPDLNELDVVDEVIKEPFGGAHKDVENQAKLIKNSLELHLSELRKLSPDNLVEDRFNKYRNIGSYID